MDKVNWLKQALMKIDTMPTDQFLQALIDSGLEFEQLDPEIAQITSENLWDLYEGGENDS